MADDICDDSDTIALLHAYKPKLLEPIIKDDEFQENYQYLEVSSDGCAFGRGGGTKDGDSD